MKCTTEHKWGEWKPVGSLKIFQIAKCIYCETPKIQRRPRPKDEQ